MPKKNDCILYYLKQLKLLVDITILTPKPFSTTTLNLYHPTTTTHGDIKCYYKICTCTVF